MFFKFLKDESGATAIEYGILAAGIGLAVVTAAATFGDTLITMFGGIVEKLEGAQDAANKT